MPDFGFVGPAYEAANPYQDCQRLINWYTELDNSSRPAGMSQMGTEAMAPTAKSVISLLGCPGLLQELSTIYGECRGGWVLPGNTSCLWVTGNTVYLITVAQPASFSTQATFSSTSVGTLLTYTGQVSIKDNGSGGIAVIVDGTNGYVYNIAAKTVTQITDPAWLGSTKVSYIDGWFIFNQPSTQKFYTSPVYWNGTSAMSASYFALKDSSSDNLVTHFDDHRELWLVGERTTEVWYDAGGTNFPFSRLQGATLQIGCSAAYSIAKLGDSIVWLGRNERGQNTVVQTQGYQYTTISNRALEHAISQYNVISDAIGYTYQEEGHEFYMLTFPTQDVTWCYDLSTGHWHQRASYDPVTGLFHRHRSNCFVNFANQRLVGDYQNGNIYQMSRKIYTDGGNPLVCVRRAPHIWDDRKRVTNYSLQIEFSPGVGLQTGQGSDPQAMLRWSNDGAATFGNEHWASIGQAGQMLNRCIWRRLGYARDRVYEVTFSDPVKRDIVGATLRAAGETV